MYKNTVAHVLKSHHPKLKIKEQLFQHLDALKNKSAVLRNLVLIRVLDLVVKVPVFLLTKRQKIKPEIHSCLLPIMPKLNFPFEQLQQLVRQHPAKIE
ncbi:hypothetical protein D9M71_337300 [compost metagenome]